MRYADHLARFVAEHAPALRAKFLAHLAQIEAAAAARKTLSDEDLAVADRAASLNGDESRSYSTWSFVEGLNLPHSRHEAGGFVYVPEDDRAQEDLRRACDLAVASAEERERLRKAARAVGNAERGRRTDKSRKANAAKRAANAVPADLFAENEAVQVHAMGRWYPGVFLRLNKNGMAVCSYTSGAGVTREKTVGADKVCKAR